MKASDLFIKCLEAERIEYIFGLPGEENADLMISLESSRSIRFILVRHEQAAAFMADMYGRLTGKVGVCLSTLGPGATNLTTGVANANMDRSPILAITGQTSTIYLHKESHQNMDAVSMFLPITKWRWSIRNPDSIPQIIRRACKISLEEKAGAVHLELPQDIAKMNSDILPIDPSQQPSRSRPSRALIERAAKMIMEAKMPLLLVGNGCIRGNASDCMREFVEKTGICSMNTFMAKGVISDRAERHLQTIGIKEADHALLAMKNSDLIVAAGYDLVEYSPKNWNSDLRKNIIHIDFTPAEVDTYYIPTIELAADIEFTIKAIIEEIDKIKQRTISPVDLKDTNQRNSGQVTKFDRDIDKREMPNLFQRIKKEVVWRNTEKFKRNLSYPIQPEKLVFDVRSALDEKDIVISDVGVHKLWISKLYETYLPNTCIIPNGFCSMGFALPAAIAAQLAKQDRKVVAMCGDGGFLMNVQDLETAVRLKLPIIVIVWCDSDYGLISLKQKEEFGKSAFTKFNNPDFAKLAESFGAIGYNIKSTTEFSRTLCKAKESTDTPIIISIGVDYSRNTLLLNDNFTALQIGHFAG
ncbi:MAG TPA: thiamine pyrophosphate-binding protein [Nitrososphaeraceae archaeon]|jgi:acetolactate synthase-1/2/3 large subunit